MPGVRFALRPEFDVTPETPAGRHPARRGPRQEPDARRAVRRLRRFAQPARVRLRRDRGGQVADRPLPARGRHRARHPVAGRRAGQGRVPADGEPAARRGSDQDQAGRAGRDRGRAQPARARGRRRGRQVSAADARGPGQGAVHRVVPGRGAVPAGAQRRARPGVRGGGLGPGARRAASAAGGRPPTHPHRPAARRRAGRGRDRLQPAGHRRRARLHQGPAGQPQARHDRAVPRGRAPARLRGAAARERRA